MFGLPLIPPLDKHNIPALSACAVSLWLHGRKGPILPQSVVGKGLVLIFILSPMLTVATNGEPVFFGNIGLPGLALSLQQFLLILPFLVARQHLASGGAQKDLIHALMIGGLVYTLPMLVEMRLSPQLNKWIYGFYQHVFAQSVRGDGFRPMVFLYHGLWVTFFTMTAVFSAFALWRHDIRRRVLLLLAALYLFAVLLLAKSLGAMIFAVALIPCVLLLGTVMQIRVALLIGLLAVAYPILKGADLVPQDQLLAKAAKIDPARAASLEFRFDNENILLERAYLKPVFG